MYSHYINNLFTCQVHQPPNTEQELPKAEGIKAVQGRNQMPSKQTCFLQKQKAGLLLFIRKMMRNSGLERVSAPNISTKSHVCLTFGAFFILNSNIRDFSQLRKRGKNYGTYPLWFCSKAGWYLCRTPAGRGSKRNFSTIFFLSRESFHPLGKSDGQDRQSANFCPTLSISAILSASRITSLFKSTRETVAT